MRQYCHRADPHEPHTWHGIIGQNTYECEGRKDEPEPISSTCGDRNPHSGHTYDGGAARGDHAWCPGNIAQVMTEPTREEELGAGLRELWDWWTEQAADEAQQVLPKAVEYGSNSLIAVGRKIALLQGREIGDEEATELGCWFYCMSKIERWTDSVLRGERPSDDTIYDARVYLGMARRNRAVGGWPHAPKDPPDLGLGEALYQAGE